MRFSPAKDDPNYQPDLDLPIFAPRELKRVARMLPKISDYRSLRQDLAQVCIWLYLGLNKLELERCAEAVQALVRVSKALENTSSTLEALPPMAATALITRTKLWKSEIGTFDRQRLASLVKELETLKKCAIEAEMIIPKRGKGRPRYTDLEFAVGRLASIWQEQTQREPTLSTDSTTGAKYGLFLEFCEAVCWGVYDHSSLDRPDIANKVEYHLYQGGDQDI